MKAMIFAAGLGTRLKPMTDVMPKALVPVCGKPLIEHVTRRLMAAGIDETVVNVHHFADMIEEWADGQDWICRDSGAKKPGMALMQFSDERQKLLETGGAVFNARKYLKGCGHFLIHNVDILSDCDLKWFCSQVRPDALGTLLVSERETSRYFLFHPQTMRLAGWMNRKTGETILADSSLTVQECKAYAFAGMHILSDKVPDIMEEYVNERGLDDSAPARFPIIDFYLWAASRWPIYGALVEDLHLLDVGKLDALDAAEKFIQETR